MLLLFGRRPCEGNYLTMAASLFTLLDDIATLLDDVAVLTHVAAKRTAGVMADDLALNSEQIAGVQPSRELPVVWAVAKGSILNKVILVPTAVVISVFAHWAIVPLLMIGGAYLCFEGFEKAAHRLLHSKEEDAARHREHVKAVADPTVDLVAAEKAKIKGAVRTDFILSAEIVVLAMGTAPDAPYLELFAMLAAIALGLTVCVYGLVAAIVRLDDAGLSLVQKKSGAARGLGRTILAVAPWIMKLLSVGGTIAMFLVGGEILAHGIAPIHTFSTWLEEMGGVLGFFGPVLVSATTGIAAGGLLVAIVVGVRRVLAKRKSAA
jgi:predicted DNA repair protein MutK